MVLSSDAAYIECVQISSSSLIAALAFSCFIQKTILSFSGYASSNHPDTVAFNLYLALSYRTFCSSILDATPSSGSNINSYHTFNHSNINSYHTFSDSNKAKSCILHNSILAYQIQNVM